MARNRLSRRSFFKTGAVGLAGAGSALSMGRALAQEAAEPEARNRRDGMRYRVLGRTNLLVSELSMGGQQATAGVLSAALDKGVNLFHTAIAYDGGNSFVEAAKVLPDRRDEVFLAVKGLTSVDQFSEWLNTLKTDRADIVCHPTSDEQDALDQTGRRREQFQALKDAGLVRFLVLTAHSNVGPVSAAAVQSGHWDAIMPQYGLALRQEVMPAVDAAHEKGVGVLGMKTLAGAQGEDRKTALQTALDKPGLTTVLKGLPSFEFLDMLVAAVNARPTAEEQASLWRNAVARRSETCAMCSKCNGCPQGLAVQETVMCLLYYDRELNDARHARQVYRSLRPEQTALACGNCGTCERVCPNDLPIREIMREAHGKFA
jgi:predicted aldo/keto reductase-like oxidoreductase